MPPSSGCEIGQLKAKAKATYTMSSSTQDLPTPNLDLGNTFGALFIGVTLAAVLFGITNVQAFIYFQTHSGTGITVYKLVVVWLWILDALHLALITHCVYYYLVTNYDNISALTEIVWSFKLHVVIDVAIIYGVHALYAYRIWIVSRGRSMRRSRVAAMGAMVILASGVSIVIIREIYQCHVFTDLPGIEWATYLSLGEITFIDSVIASSLCYLLATSRTGFSSTDSLLTKLMAYIINTGLLTSVISVVAVITCAAMPRNFISISIEFLIAKLYVNSYIALLNAPYYLQPKNLSELRHHDRPTLHSGESEGENLRKNTFRHSYDHDDRTYPLQAVKPKRPVSVTMDINSFSSV
ncbi:hypothetical protein M405DRAFT_815512 [Rhizopogon salebrosus TDB-379]|nr:hypothetical protein M405DRAFT_815512 [Rhizopogon salebrosus TDB-379]